MGGWGTQKVSKAVEGGWVGLRFAAAGRGAERVRPGGWPLLFGGHVEACWVPEWDGVG